MQASYRVGPVLGRGGYSLVYAGTRIRDRAPVAIKKVNKTKVKTWGTLNNRRVPMEIILLQKVNHLDNVTKLLDYYEYSDCFLIITDRPKSVMDLFDYITENGALNEELAKKFFGQILKCTMECHACGVFHRDIKDENIIVNLDTLELTLIDFGSGSFHKRTMFTTFDGTLVCAPPEWFMHEFYYADGFTVWTLGILLFNMVQGNIPFHTEEEIVKMNPRFTVPISGECKDLIVKCLCSEIRRITLLDVSRHPWLAE